MRERILTIGGAGSGKTEGWMRLALRFKAAQFYVIDTQLSAERSLQAYPSVQNVTIYPAVDWLEYRAAQKEIEKLSQPNDWAVLDMADMSWPAVQREYVDGMFDKELGDYWLEARRKLTESKAAKKGFPVLDGWKDWSVINKMYDDFMFSLVYRVKANLYMTAMATPVSEDDEKEIRELYGPYGLKPAGQKALGHQPDTVLLLAHSERDRWTYTTIKDRGGRKYVERAPLINFALQYGVIASWR
jgi:hypothetical protein